MHIRSFAHVESSGPSFVDAGTWRLLTPNVEVVGWERLWLFLSCLLQEGESHCNSVVAESNSGSVGRTGMDRFESQNPRCNICNLSKLNPCVLVASLNHLALVDLPVPPSVRIEVEEAPSVTRAGNDLPDAHQQQQQQDAQGQQSRGNTRIHFFM